MARILVDTSAVYALLDRGDRWHAVATAALEELRRKRTEPMLTNFIVAECHALMLSRLGAKIARQWLLESVWPIERVSSQDEARARTILGQYMDKSFAYTDTTSFAVMERLGLDTAFAFDPHFKQYGFKVIGITSIPKG